MKRLTAFIMALLLLAGCAAPCEELDTTSSTDIEASVSATRSDGMESTEAETQTASEEESQSTEPRKTEGEQQPTGASAPQKQEPAPKPSEPKESQPAVTAPPATTPPATTPPETLPTATEPPATEPPSTEPHGTESPATEPEETEPQITYEFKRQVAAYAVQYINQYRGSPCTVLSGMSKVAQYRASQLTWNYSHSTADKRAALAYYEYGRYIDATEFGDDASNSYWEADSAEAICAGFKGADAQTMGKYIADMMYNSFSHWSYIGSSQYSYIGVGVEYREGSQYGWYACVMVGSVNYG